MAEHDQQKAKARGRAEAIFTASEQRDAAVHEQIRKERAAADAKTARLKALRLAKEAAEKAAGESGQAEDGTKPAASKRGRARKPGMKRVFV
jgi:hypothetical protein